MLFQVRMRSVLTSQPLPGSTGRGKNRRHWKEQRIGEILVAAGCNWLQLVSMSRLLQQQNTVKYYNRQEEASPNDHRHHKLQRKLIPLSSTVSEKEVKSDNHLEQTQTQTTFVYPFMLLQLALGKELAINLSLSVCHQYRIVWH